MAKPGSHNILDFQDSEEELEFLSQLQDAIPIGVAVVDAQGRLMHVNNAMCTVAGIPAEELCGRSMKEMVVTECPLEAAMARRPQDAELPELPTEAQPVTIVNASGQTRQLDVFLRHLKIGNRGPLFLLACEDVTNNRERVETEKLADKQAFDRQKAQSLGRFAAGVAHRFNNLLTSIMGYTELAKMPGHSRDEITDFLDEVQVASRQAASLTGDLLASSGKGHFIIEPVNLSNWIKDTLPDLLRGLTIPITVHSELAHDLPLIDADPAQLSKLVVYLLQNAADAIDDDGSIVIRTSTHELDDTTAASLHASRDETKGGQFAVLEIKDDGEGIADDDLESICDPYFTTRFHGRGLAMSAVRGIVQGHNGLLQIESEVGTYTLVRVYFPLRQVPQQVVPV